VERRQVETSNFVHRLAMQSISIRQVGVVVTT